MDEVGAMKVTQLRCEHTVADKLLSLQWIMINADPEIMEL